MTDRVLVDNDVILKFVLWGLHEEALAMLSIGGDPPSALGVAKYVIAGRLRKAPSEYRTEVAGLFDGLWPRFASIEPTDDEMSVAADFETTAISMGLELDGGESLLLAVLVSRGAAFMVTGDKRAIGAMAVVAPREAHGRVVCLEQIIACLIDQAGVQPLRVKICARPGADRAVTICFSCGREADPSVAEVHECLTSYVNDIAKNAPDVLASRDELERALVA